jgi:hypothetical protein
MYQGVIPGQFAIGRDFGESNMASGAVGITFKALDSHIPSADGLLFLLEIRIVDLVPSWLSSWILSFLIVVQTAIDECFIVDIRLRCMLK